MFSDQDGGSELIKSDDGCFYCCCLQFALNFKVRPRCSLHAPLKVHRPCHFRITFHHTVYQQSLQFCNFCQGFEVENRLCSGTLILIVILTDGLSSFSSVQTFFSTLSGCKSAKPSPAWLSSAMSLRLPHIIRKTVTSLTICHNFLPQVFRVHRFILFIFCAGGSVVWRQQSVHTPLPLPPPTQKKVPLKERGRLAYLRYQGVLLNVY